MRGIEARSDGEQALKTAEQQAGAYQQQQGESDLSHDQSPAGQLLTSSGTPRTLLEPDMQVALRHMQCRGDPDREPDQDRHPDAEDEDRHIHLNGGQPRHIRWTQGHQSAHADSREGHSQSTAHQGQEQALHEQLPDQASSSRSQCRSHGELTVPLRPAGQHKISDIHGGNSQHQDYSTKQRQQRRPDAACHVIPQRINDQTVIHGAPGRSGKLRHWAARDFFKLPFSLLHRDALPQPCDRAEVMSPLRAIGGKRSIILQERPDPGRWRQYILEAGRHYACHGVETVIQRDLAPHNGMITMEAALPDSVAEDNHIGTSAPIVCRIEIVSQGPRHTEHMEVCRRDTISVQSLGLERARQCRLP